MSKVSLAFSKNRPNILVWGLLLLCFAASIHYLFISGPGSDGGSGLGGTGRFGADNGLGGQGGPSINLGGIDQQDKDDSTQASEELLEYYQPAQTAMGLLLPSSRSVMPQLPPVQIDSLRLTPEKDGTALTSYRNGQATAGTEVRFAVTVSEISRSSLENERQRLESLRSSGIASTTSSGLQNDMGLVRDISQVSEAAITTTLEVSRQLLLAESATVMSLESVEETTAGLEVGSDADPRRSRVSVPVRPERPDRPVTPVQRFAPVQRNIPTPPVRPLRI